jgi:hypothetical protein
VYVELRLNINIIYIYTRATKVVENGNHLSLNLNAFVIPGK